MKSDSFEEHFEKLIEFYGADISKLPTPDMILEDYSYLGEKSKWGMDYPQMMELFGATLEEFKERYRSYGEVNVLVLSNFDNLAYFANWCAPELFVLTVRTVTEEFFNPIEYLDELPEFKKLMDVYQSFFHHSN